MKFSLVQSSQFSSVNEYLENNNIYLSQQYNGRQNCTIRILYIPFMIYDKAYTFGNNTHELKLRATIR